MSRPCPPRFRRPARGLLALALLAVVAAVDAAGPRLETLAAPAQGGDVLAELSDAIRAARRPTVVDGVPDHGPEAIEARGLAVQAIRKRFDALEASSWAMERKIDYLLVRAQLAAAEFDLDVVRPWARDPGLTVDLVRRAPYAEVPTDDEGTERLARSLRAVPRIVEQGRARLTTPSGQLARMAARQLSTSDGVNQGEPRRDPPPAGVIGWYGDLRGRLAASGSALLPLADEALRAVESFHDWLVETEPTMTEPAWVGLEAYDRYLREVLLMPYTSAELRVIAARELARARTFLAIERHRNRGLPEIRPAASAQEHADRVEEAEALIRSFMAQHELLTVPSDLPPRFETDAFWIVRPGGTRHFWEEITYRDPLNNHIHASIPGHRFDGIIGRRETRPIRRGYRDGVRAEGWAFYIEEMFLQAGLLDDRPRAKELFYIAQLKRAARVPAELAMQTGEIDLEGAIDYLVQQVPLMEPDLARYDLAIYLRRPTYGMNYVMGKVMLEQLLSDRALQLGDRFDLGVFHDEFLAAGPIPIPLIRWQMTGLDDEVEALWDP